MSLSDLAEGPWGPNRGPLPHAELAWCCLKMVFTVSVLRVITGLSWCRPERTVKHVPWRATDCPLMPNVVRCSAGSSCSAAHIHAQVRDQRSPDSPYRILSLCVPATPHGS